MRRGHLKAASAALLALLVPLSSLTLSACASDQPPVIDRVAGAERVHGDADHVSVAGGRLDALPLAVFHCARYGRSAQFSRSEDGRSVFDCVTKPQ